MGSTEPPKICNFPAILSEIGKKIFFPLAPLAKNKIFAKFAQIRVKLMFAGGRCRGSDPSDCPPDGRLAPDPQKIVAKSFLRIFE